MQVPLELTLKNFEDKNGAIAQVVEEKLQKLERVCPRITSCHVVVEQFQNPKHNHHSYSIHIVATFPPHHEVVITRDPNKGEIQEKLLTTQLRESFVSLRRQIQEIMDKDRGRVKTHENGEGEAPIEDELKLEEVE